MSKMTERPMEIFWTSDDASSTSSALVHVPGVNDVGNARPRSYQRTNLTYTAVNNNNNENQKLPKRADRVNTTGKHERKVSLKDLCSEDKKRVANLIKELAKTGLEKETALEQLNKERQIFEQQVNTLQQQQQKIVDERQLVQEQYKECQEMLVQYQRQIVEQQEKLSTSIHELTSPRNQVKHNINEVQSGPPQPSVEMYTPHKVEEKYPKNNTGKLHVDHGGDRHLPGEMNGKLREEYSTPPRTRHHNGYERHGKNGRPAGGPERRDNMRAEQGEDYSTPPRTRHINGYAVPQRQDEREGNRPSTDRVQWVGYDVPPQSFEVDEYSAESGFDERERYIHPYQADTPNHPYTRQIDHSIRQHTHTGYQDMRMPQEVNYPNIPVYNNNNNIYPKNTQHHGDREDHYPRHQEHMHTNNREYQDNNPKMRRAVKPGFKYNGQLADHLPEPVMTSTQASQYTSGKNYNTLPPDYNDPSLRYRNISAILNHSHEKEGSRNRMMSKVRWADHGGPGQNGIEVIRHGSPVSTNFHDHMDSMRAAQNYKTLTPEQRKLDLLRQREGLMAEQARLRSILQEQEATLKCKQDQLQEQHRLQRARLWHFEKTGQFPEGEDDDGLQKPQMSAVDNMILDGTLEGDDLFTGVGDISHASRHSVPVRDTSHHSLPYIPPKNTADDYQYSILRDSSRRGHREGTPTSETEENLEFLSQRGVDVSALSPVRIQGKRSRHMDSDNSSRGYSDRVDVATSPVRGSSLKQGNIPPRAHREEHSLEGILKSPRNTSKSLADIVDSIETSRRLVGGKTPDDLFEDDEETEESQVLEEIFFLK